MFAYASGNFGKALVFAGADLTLLFLMTDLLGLTAGRVGTLMLAALAGDLVFDLLAAMLVIRLRRSGRGYRWLVAVGVLPCGLAFLLLYAMPALGMHHGWSVACALLVFRGAYAIIDVPHNALMAQISSDSRARGRISGYRLLFSTASSLAVAMILTPLVQQAARDRGFDMLAVAGGIAGTVFVVTMLLCVVATRGVADPHAHPVEQTEDGIAIPIGDRLVLGMALLAVFTGFAVSAFGRMLLYIAPYVLDRPALAGPVLIALTAGQFAGVLAWTALTARFDKSRLLAAGHGVTLAGLILFGCCLGRSEMLPGCAALIGFGFAAVFMLPWGLLADTVDFVAWRHGRRFETGLFAGYLVAVKASGAASTALIGWTLGGLGYVPGQAQTMGVQAGMLALGLGLPIAGCVGAIVVLRHFAIGHDRHRSVQAALARRHAAAAPDQSGAEPVSGLNRGLEKSIGDGVVLPPGDALSAQARQSMSRSIVAPAVVCE